jgi:hypothetical protein
MTRSMDQTVSIRGAATLRAGLMDPWILTEKSPQEVDDGRAATLTTNGLDTVWRDVGNRSAGIAAGLRSV